MDEVVAFLVLLAGAGAIVSGAVWFARRGARKDARARARADRDTPWSAAVLAPSGRGLLGTGSTRVVVRRLTGKGEVLDWSLVAEIPEGAADWAALVGQARAEAETRAAILNSEA